MGRRGPIARTDTETRGRPGRRAPTGPVLPPEVIEKTRRLFTDLWALGDRYWAATQRTLAQDDLRRAPPSLDAALKCYREAIGIAYRLGGVPAPVERDPLVAHLGKRPKVAAIGGGDVTPP